MRTLLSPETTSGLRWGLALLALVITALLPAWETDARAARFVRVKVDVANLRARPSPASERVRSAFQNEPLHVVGRQGQWFQVRDVAGEAGWIYAPLTDDRQAVVVVRDVVNVREQPGAGHPVVFTAERGVSLLVLEHAGRWLRVEHEVGVGWLHDSLVWGSR